MFYLSGFFIIVGILALFLFAYVAHKELVSSILFEKEFLERTEKES